MHLCGYIQRHVDVRGNGHREHLRDVECNDERIRSDEIKG